MESLFDTGSAESSAHYVWEVPDKPIAVRISPEAIDRILTEASRAMSLIPRRGTEAGGVLLGTVEPGETITVHIEDVAPVPIEYLFGPSYSLSSKDKEKLKEVLAQWEPSEERELHTVGFYRTNLADQLSMTKDDVELFGEYFFDPSHVVLLVKPRALRSSLAAVFFWEDGQVQSEHSYLEFPVRSRRAPKQELPAEETDSLSLPSFLGEAPVKGTAGLEELELPQFGMRRKQPLWVSWWVQIPILLCLLMVEGLLGYTFGLQITPPAAARQAQQQLDPYKLSLLVVKYGDNLYLTWDRNAPALSSARRGSLTITDGAQNRTIDLTLTQLRNGSVVYHHLTNEVHFRLEVVLEKGRSLSETWDLTPREPVPIPDATPAAAPAK